MLALLADLFEETTDANPYLGLAGLREARAEYSRVAETAHPLELVTRGLELSRLEMRAGQVAQAVEELSKARSVLHRLDAPHPRLDLKILYELALAHLRLAETSNCVARHTSQSCILPIGTGGVHVVQGPSRAAMDLFSELLARDDVVEPMRSSSLWLLNIAAMTVGDWPNRLPEKLRVPPTVFDSDQDFPHFVDVAPELGINSFDLCGGALAEDFDGDGIPDLLTSTWDPHGSMHLFLGNGSGGFTEATDRSGLEGMPGGLNMVQADYDNDGDIDVLVLRGGWIPGEAGRQPNSLLRNDGHGFFTDVTFLVGLGDRHWPTQTAAFADYDLDGDLDLYIGNESSPNAPCSSQLFRNDGKGSFTEVTAEAGVSNMRYAKAVTWGDFDGDRDPDLYVSNLLGSNRLYRNEGDGTFTDVAGELGVMDPYDSFAAWFFDYDNDGALDLYVASYSQGSQEGNHAAFRLYPTVASYLDLPCGAETARLYRGDGSGGFEDVTERAGLGAISLTMGANFGDLDNDGLLDFYLGTGYPNYDGLVPNVMYRNRGDGTFADVTSAGGFGHLQKGHGVVFCDFDGDGDQDVFEEVGGAYRGDGFGNVLFQNPGNANHWAEIQLAGVRSNAFGVGARITATIREHGTTRTIHRVAGAGGSFGGNPLWVHLGLGSAVEIENLDVFWPVTGEHQRFERLPGDHRLLILEGDPAVRILDSAAPQ